MQAEEGSEMARYAALLSTGSYAARYLGIGLGGDVREARRSDGTDNDSGGGW